MTGKHGQNGGRSTPGRDERAMRRDAMADRRDLAARTRDEAAEARDDAAAFVDAELGDLSRSSTHSALGT